MRVCLPWLLCSAHFWAHRRSARSVEAAHSGGWGVRQEGPARKQESQAGLLGLSGTSHRRLSGGTEQGLEGRAGLQCRDQTGSYPSPGVGGGGVCGWEGHWCDSGRGWLTDVTDDVQGQQCVCVGAVSERRTATEASVAGDEGGRVGSPERRCRHVRHGVGVCVWDALRA